MSLALLAAVTLGAASTACAHGVLGIVPHQPCALLATAEEFVVAEEVPVGQTGLGAPAQAYAIALQKPGRGVREGEWWLYARLGRGESAVSVERRLRPDELPRVVGLSTSTFAAELPEQKVYPPGQTCDDGALMAASVRAPDSTTATGRRHSCWEMPTAVDAIGGTLFDLAFDPDGTQGVTVVRD